MLLLPEPVSKESLPDDTKYILYHNCSLSERKGSSLLEIWDTSPNSWWFNGTRKWLWILLFPHHQLPSPADFNNKSNLFILPLRNSRCNQWLPKQYNRSMQTSIHASPSVLQWMVQGTLPNHKTTRISIKQICFAKINWTHDGKYIGRSWYWHKTSSCTKKWESLNFSGFCMTKKNFKLFIWAASS